VCLLRYVIEIKLEGRVEVKGTCGKEVSSYRTTLRKSEVTEIERGNTRLHAVENSRWRRLWTCRQTDKND
jgi:hypothetical protein